MLLLRKASCHSMYPLITLDLNLDSRVGLRYATLRTTLRYVCFFGQNYDTELRYVIYCYVTELRYLLINAANYFIVLRYAICHHPLPSGNG